MVTGRASGRMGVPCSLAFGQRNYPTFLGNRRCRRPRRRQATQAIINWRGLRPEERWFLYDLINAASGGINDRHGWRKAIKWGLLENPVDEKEIRQLELFEPPQDPYNV